MLGLFNGRAFRERSESGRLLIFGLFAFAFHELQSLLLDFLDALRGAVLLLVLQVALEEKLDLLHRNAQVDHAVEQRPGRQETLTVNERSRLNVRVGGASPHLTSFWDPCLIVRSMKTDHRSVRFG